MGIPPKKLNDIVGRVPPRGEPEPSAEFALFISPVSPHPLFPKAYWKNKASELSKASLIGRVTK